MINDLCFGFPEKDIVRTKTMLESLFGITFRERESSYYGVVYFRFDSKESGQFILQENFDSVESEWVEEDHQDLPLLLHVSCAPDPESVKRILALAEGCRLIRERQR